MKDCRPSESYRAIEILKQLTAPEIEHGSDVHESRALGEVEVTLFFRSATLGHNRCSNAGLLWNDDIDGKLCAALNAAFAEWAVSHALVLPTGAELRVARDEARRAASEADRPARKKARVAQ